MAFTNSAVWEVQTGGSDTNNGGGFDPGVAGFPTDGAATLATSSAPVFTSASYTFVAGDVGASLYIKSGTNWTAGWYSIASVSAGAATLSAALGAGVLGNNSGVTTAAGCATTASPTAATWGIDYSQSATSRLTFSDLVIGATTTQFTSAGNPVGKNFVGNIISITSGTGFTVQRVAVVSTSGTTATCDKTLGTAASTGGNGRMGGALASPGQCAAIVSSNGNVVFIKAGTYSVTSATGAVSGGCVIPGQSATWVGYSTVRTTATTDTKPVIQVAVSTATLVGVGAWYNLTLDGNAQVSAKLNNVGQATFVRCACKNFTSVAAASTYYFCSFTGYTVNAVTGLAVFCEAYSNTATPFSLSANNSHGVFFCIARSNTGASTDGFALNGLNQAQNCISYANGRDGFRVNGVAVLLNCHAEGNTGFGFNSLTGFAPLLISCSAYSNTSGATTVTSGGSVNAAFLTSNFHTITAGSVFTNAATGDFSLNNIIAQGASLRGAGGPSAFPVSPTAGYLDAGIAQHADPSIITLARMFTGF